jgi:hypothetical protein
MTPTRIITIALAILAVAAPAAGASPIRDGSPPIAPPHKANVYVPPAVSPAPTVVAATTHQPAVVDDSGTSPLVYVLPIVALAALLCGTALFVRSARQPLRA